MNVTRWAPCFLGFLTGFIMVVVVGIYIINAQLPLADNFTPTFVKPVVYEFSCFNPTPFIMLGIAVIGATIYYIFLNRNEDIK